MRENLLGRAFHALAGGLVLLATSAGSTAGAGQPLTLSLQDGELAADSDTYRFKEGEAITIIWTSDRPVELHLHGYDVTVEAGPATPGPMRFTGSVTGRFPVTWHGAGGAHHTLIYVEIHPR